MPLEEMVMKGLAVMEEVEVEVVLLCTMYMTSLLVSQVFCNSF